jgi:bifunctional UDP-N-acetylglucosamine pyrophosphorylase/glucosamine-1-phosphate N-acetyltransferase
MTDTALIVLAAGMGTRMKSALPKVLHQAANRSLLGHVLSAARSVNPQQAVVVTGPDTPAVGQEARRYFEGADIAFQADRLGTAHAVSMAKDALSGFEGTVIVLYGDVPLIQSGTISAMASAVGASSPMAVLGFEAAVPTGYGRLIRSAAGHVTAIREELDASPEERKIKLCNSGIISISSKLLWELLAKVDNKNAKGEYYLTDLVELANAAGHPVELRICPESEVMGVNTRMQLAEVEAHLQASYRLKAMTGGATLVAPETVFFSADTKIGTDVLIEPNAVIGPGVEIGNNVSILAFSHLEGAKIADGARIGPYARLRPGARIGADAHVGNFVEIKNAEIGQGAKANHLTYIGDARVGAKSNIGAGTITCNYDGYEKHLTDIGSEVFVGSNTALVAPVKIGDGSNIGAGSVITKDVPANALALTRPALEVREGWATKYREIKKARKKSKA